MRARSFTDVKIQQTLRNARFIGEMAFKGVEREIRKRLTPTSPVKGYAEEIPQEETTIAEPFEGYGLLTARQIIEQARSWSDERKIAARSYESATRNRRSVVQALS